MASNPMMATMLKSLGIDPAAIAKMGGDIGAAFASLTQAAKDHTDRLIRIEEKLDAVMDHFGVSLPLTPEQEILVARETEAHLAQITEWTRIKPDE